MKSLQVGPPYILTNILTVIKTQIRATLSNGEGGSKIDTA